MTDELFEQPLYFPTWIGKPRWRELAAYDAGARTLSVRGGATYEIQNIEELVEKMFSLNLLTFVRKIDKLPDELIDFAIEHGEVWCRPDGTATSLCLKGPRRTTRWIVSCASWGVKMPTLEFLDELAKVFKLADVGTVSSPGSLGISLLKASFFDQYRGEWKQHRHDRPAQIVCDYLKSTGTGARSEHVSDQHYFQELIELDQKNAYGAVFQKLPTGKSIRFFDGDVEPFVSYYADCLVTIKEPLAYGLFPAKNQEGETCYPTQPATYAISAFKHEIDFYREQGLDVEVGDGYGWLKWTTDTRLFVQTLERLRDTHPELASYFKQALVAGIGRLGMDRYKYRLTDQQTDKRYVAGGRAFDLYIEKIEEKRPESMPHWFWFVLSMCRLALTKQALQWEEGELIATNTDAVFLAATADISAIPDRSEKASLPAGSWTSRTLTNVRMPERRMLISDQKIALPGVADKDRKKYIARLEEDDAPF